MVKGAQWITIVLQKELIKGSYVPEPVIQELRQYNRCIFYLNRSRQRAEVCIDSTLQRCNIRLSNYVSDIGSKSMRKVVMALINGETDAENLLGLVHKRIRNKHSDQTIQSSLIGIVSEADRGMLRLNMEEIAMYERQVKACEQKMAEICRIHYQTEVELLQSIPGIKEKSAKSIIAETGVDMKAFLTAATLVGWAGLRPRNDQSARKIKGRKILHGNKYLRIMLIQCAWAASRTQSSRFHLRYNTLKKRMNHNKSLFKF